MNESGIPLAFVIAGHHAGLSNLRSSAPGLPTPLCERLQENTRLLKNLRIPANVSGLSLPQLPAHLRAGKALRHDQKGCLARSSEFWIRFLFSALVDADRLDTEAFLEPQVAALRGRSLSISALRERLDSSVDTKAMELSPSEKARPMNLLRAEVLARCRGAAALQPGVFSLTVPTGGGKTLSSMSFALNHAERFGLRRVIVVIPYTSIIEQNADVYRQALGCKNVVEHHSNLDPAGNESKNGEEPALRQELACENWDAPVIVTTTVQFFESLFSNHPSRCRKLHNIACSVVILDEVQTLPPGFLLSILDALTELTVNYGCSIVLSTATPPALAARTDEGAGLRGVREIMTDTSQLARRLSRVEYSWPEGDTPPLAWAEIAQEMADHHQVLTVVHKRDDARELARELMGLVPADSVWHLSALLCAAHRSAVLEQIKRRLAQGGDCRVVSTQLVEAGVDLDFPVVYRAMGGLDSIVQAAGRCNREGHLPKGQVRVFRAPTSPPRGTPRQAMEVTEALLQELGGNLNPADPMLFEKYFRMLYLMKDPDASRIQPLRQEFNFASVGREFRLIEDGFTKPIVVPFGESERRVQDLRLQGPNRDTLRGLQRFIVNVYPDAFARLSNAGALEEVTEGVFILAKPFEDIYDRVFGLMSGDEPQANPCALIT